MWGIEYSDEVKYYFLDNYPYTFELLVEIEKLRYAPDAMPSEGVSEIEAGIFMWEVLSHLVYYRKYGQTIGIVAVKPL